MKKTVLLLGIGIVCFSCKDYSRGSIEASEQKEDEVSIEQNTINSEEVNILESKTISYLEVIKEEVKNYQELGLNVNKSERQNYLGEVFTTKLNLPEFIEVKSVDGKPIKYYEIPKVITSSRNWVKIGEANQASLQKCNELALDGQLVVGFDPDKIYHGIIVFDGQKINKSTSWKMDVPSCVRFNPSNPRKSFESKGVNYAFSSSEGLEIWVRNNN